MMERKTIQVGVAKTGITDCGYREIRNGRYTEKELREALGVDEKVPVYISARGGFVNITTRRHFHIMGGESFRIGVAY